MIAPDLFVRLDALVEESIAPAAVGVDADAAFPAASIEALRAGGWLGLVSAPEVGGMGGTPLDAARVIERLARACGSTAMVTCMHYAAAAVVEAHGTEAQRKGLAQGELSTLAFSEAGSRSHFWAPMGTATVAGDQATLEADKSWVTSAQHATTYVWSSRAASGEGVSMWLVPAKSQGLSIPRRFDGLGLRGNDSTPVQARGVQVPLSARLGDDGSGFGTMMSTVLPLFSFMNASCSVGLAGAALTRAIAHVSGARYAHLDQSLADLPTIRAYVAKASIDLDTARALLHDGCQAAIDGREDAMLRVLQSKAACGEMALRVCDTAMRVCGGAAFRKDVGVERYARDARAASVMAPTSDQLFDFIGKALCGLELF